MSEKTAKPAVALREVTEENLSPYSISKQTKNKGILLPLTLYLSPRRG